MKKRICSMLLALVLVFGMIPITSMTASAVSLTDLNFGDLVFISTGYTTDGVNINNGEPSDDIESYAYWNVETCTLTLKNYNTTIQKSSTSRTYAIGPNGKKMNVKLIGSNNINASSFENGFDSVGGIKITGNGSLYIKAECAINCSGELEILDTTVVAHSPARSSAIKSDGIKIENSNVTAKIDWITSQTVYCGIESNGNVNITNSNITATGSQGKYVCGVGIKGQNISISKSVVSATGGIAMFAYGSCSIANESFVTLTSNNTNRSDISGIYCSNSNLSIDVSDSTIICSSTKWAFNVKPTLSNKNVIWYGTDENSAVTAGPKSASEISSAYKQKYLKIMPNEHEHQFEYSADEDKISVVCKVDGDYCICRNNVVSIVAPEVAFNGNEKIQVLILQNGIWMIH